MSVWEMVLIGFLIGVVGVVSAVATVVCLVAVVLWLIPGNVDRADLPALGADRDAAAAEMTDDERKHAQSIADAVAEVPAMADAPSAIVARPRRHCSVCEKVRSVFVKKSLPPRSPTHT